MKKKFNNNKLEDIQIVFGRHPVTDAIKNGRPVSKVLLMQGTRGEFEREIRHLTRDHGIPLQFVPKEKMNRLTKANHQGLIAYLSPIPYHKLEDILPAIYEKGETPLFVLLDGITDVRNFGAIARSAECAGAHAVVISQKKGAMITPAAVKTSAGALSTIPVCREKSIAAAIEYLQGSGIVIASSSLRAKKNVFDVDLTTPLALVLGSEDNGISSTVAKMSDELFIIPQQGTTDSFNVSVAAGIMLYECTRQRLK